MAKKKTVGRPRVSAAKRTRGVSVNFTPDQFRWLDAQTASGHSRSDIVRSLVQSGMDAAASFKKKAVADAK